jgi:hypothetical protein
LIPESLHGDDVSSPHERAADQREGHLAPARDEHVVGVDGQAAPRS